MLRLKNPNITIVPEHIESIDVTSKWVTIECGGEQCVTVTFKTDEDAILFRTYVELLIELSNSQVHFHSETRQSLGSYFVDYLRPSDIDDGREKIMEHVRAKRKAEKPLKRKRQKVENPL